MAGVKRHEKVGLMPKEQKPRKPPVMEAFRYLTLLTNVGLTMVFCILVSFGIGLFLESRFNSGGAFLVVFTILGIMTGLFYLYKVLTRFLDDESEK